LLPEASLGLESGGEPPRSKHRTTTGRQPDSYKSFFEKPSGRDAGFNNHQESLDSSWLRFQP
jgi:hypothetical protein